MHKFIFLFFLASLLQLPLFGGSSSKNLSPTAKTIAYQRYRQSHLLRQKNPSDAKAWYEEGKDALAVGAASSFKHRQAYWRQHGRRSLGQAAILAPEDPEIKQALNNFASEQAKKNFSFDLDLLVLGGANHGYLVEFLPLRFVFTKPGFGLVVHPCLNQMRLDGRWEGAPLSGATTKNTYFIQTTEVFALEIQQRIWAWGEGGEKGFWAPFVGRGLSLNAYGLTCPWTRIQSKQIPADYDGRQVWDSGQASKSFLNSGYVVMGQDYELGLRLDGSFYSLAAGYSTISVPGMLGTNDKGIKENLAATTFSSWFGRLELKLF